MKIAVFMNALMHKGGVEREILTLGKHFDIDIYTGKYQKEMTFEEFKTYNIIVFKEAEKLPRRLMTLYLRHKFATLKLKKYDFYITFGSAALNITKNHHPNMWYCNAPQRWMYDLREHEENKLPFHKRMLSKIMVPTLRYFDQKYAKHADIILVNSINIQKRVTKFYRLKSHVVYPPTNTKNFKFIKQGDFFLSSARLDRIKRVDLIVKAFQKMPNKKLVILSGGPDEQKIKNMCKGYDNIKLVGWVSEKKLYEYYGTCLATVYLSYKEDYGLIPIESNSAGKPCIATNDGGFKETIVHKKTGYLVDDPTNADEVIKAVEWIEKNSKNLRKDCEQRAKLFSEIKFIEGIKEGIRKAANNNKRKE